MIKVSRLRLNHGALQEELRCRVTGEASPRFSWAVLSDGQNGRQAACRLKVWCGTKSLWDSGWMDTEEQEAAYGGAPLPTERRIEFSVTVRDNRGETSEERAASFFLSGLEGYRPAWIAAPEDVRGRAVYFRRAFHLRETPAHAALYLCGLGYHQATLNGERLDGARLDPAFTDYTRTVPFVMFPELEKRLQPGENCLGVIVGEGWRRNEGWYLHSLGERKVDFFGQPQLSAILCIEYPNGDRRIIPADGDWLCGPGDIVFNHLFDGETVDRRGVHLGWDLPGKPPPDFCPAVPAAAPGGRPRLMELEPIREQEVYPARRVIPLREGVQVVDFGQNLAGVCRLRLPKNLQPGQVITIEHMEFLDEDGSLYLPTLRGAKCRDTYIAAGDARDLLWWQPTFTYHGFRYAQITGLPCLEREDVCAVSLYTDVAETGRFTCGSALVNAIQKAIVQTEKSNLHSILTDCPQRDERMGWLNDATVRFEETPYNFDIGRLFPKVLQDILDTQGEDGSITCTAPRIYGERPADPVCSSFLVAGMQALLHTGNREVIRRCFDGFVRWEECLAAHAEGYIVNYSHYGDWAGPVYACVGGNEDIDAVQSRYTPGVFMSTGYFYYNAVLLTRFAALLKKPEEEARFRELARRIREAMLAKWWHADSGLMATGSQGCQSFALWLGILPEESRALAARRLHEDLAARDYRITTANLCTRYLMDALTENGYIEDAWKLITREEYPSLGYMLQNEATTIWERFELKKTTGMNSHNHPMYGAVGYWFYAYIAGIRPTAPGFSEVEIEPYFPEKLLSANAVIETVKGELSVRWVRQFGQVCLQVAVPFGVVAHVRLHGKTHTVGSGFWIFKDANGDECRQHV